MLTVGKNVLVNGDLATVMSVRVEADGSWFASARKVRSGVTSVLTAQSGDWSLAPRKAPPSCSRCSDTGWVYVRGIDGERESDTCPEGCLPPKKVAS